MQPPQHHVSGIGRRQFLAQVSLATAATGLVCGAAGAAESGGSAPAGAASPMPSIQLGTHRVSRLVCGSNPINGYSYMGPHMDQHMREYFTVERVVEFLLNCEKQGINTHQFAQSGWDKSLQAIRIVRERGSKMQFILLHADPRGIKDAVEKAAPIAMVHHGGKTDTLFADGKKQQVRDYVKAVRDQGILAGVSAHNPDCIRRIADEGWEVDFFMTCFYFITRDTVLPAPARVASPSLNLSYPFFRDDPQAMTQVIRQVKQPCLAFKILGAGRMCQNAKMVRQAFEFAFTNIKPIDGVIVGMYPRFNDEIRTNAQHAREIG